MTENPYQATDDVNQANKLDSQSLSAGRATYNVVTDTVTGVNIRWSDNRFQALFVLGSVIVLALLGGIAAFANAQWDLPWYGGAIAGAFIGLVAGTIVSGVILMLFRASRHLKGKHD